MPARPAVLADDQAILEIWNDNQVLMRAMGVTVPDWTIQEARSWIIRAVQLDRARVGVWTNPQAGNRVDAVLAGTRQPPHEEALIWLIRLVRNAQGQINVAASEARFVSAFESSVDGLLRGWFLTARNQGITQCEGWYPLPPRGRPEAVALLNRMSQRNGVAPILHPDDNNGVISNWPRPPRKGWQGYLVTPNQGLVGVGVIP